MALRRNGNKACKFVVDCAMEGGHRVYPAAFRPVRVNAFAAPNGRVDGMSIALRFPNSNPFNGDEVTQFLYFSETSKTVTRYSELRIGIEKVG